jgi:hypothetical protein
MFRFRRGKEPTTHHPEHSDHDHNEVDEALHLAETKMGRKKLLAAALGNVALLGMSAATAAKGNADSTWIETVHNFGDTSYYIIPWLATLKSHIHSKEALSWMRRTSFAAGALALSSMATSAYDTIANGAQHPEAFSAPAQFAFALGNAAIALYVAKQPGETTIDKAAVRHAKNDAKTSIVAGIGNALALAYAPLNAVSALVVGSMTLKTELTTVGEATEALGHLKQSDATS